MAIVFMAAPTHAAAEQVATGDSSACAVADGKVKCWGNNASGQLGNRSETSSNKPVSVDTKAAWTETKKGYCKGGSLGSVCFGLWIPEYQVRHAASALNGKSVTKVSVGKDHACALASAQVFCWGDNSSGELGNSTTKSSSIPITVDNKAAWTETIPAYCSGEANLVSGCASPTGTWVAEEKVAHGDSAIKNKEIIDISAGEDFTCALASDGSVACWGNGTNGRLGNGTTNSSKFPVAINSSEAFAGKKGVQLAKAAGATMCVIAKGASNAIAGTPYCWGVGIDNGSAIPANTSSPTACDKNSPTSNPSASSTEVIFESTKPVAVTGATIASIDGDAYLTGHGTDGRAYYWGQYGYKQNVTYSNVRTCKVNPCTGKVVIQREDSANIVLAANGRPPSGSGGLNNNKKNPANNNGPGTGYNGHPGMATHTRYSGNDNNNSCTMTRTHYGFVKNTSNSPVGQKVTTAPPSWPQSQSSLSAVSGNVYNGLFCAVTASGPQCDAHGGNTKTGQLGNGKTTQLSGPQAVVSNGWLAGKQITQLSTGKTGYTCAVASGAVGCWGVNNKGQLGVGDTSSKNVPTGVGL